MRDDGKNGRTRREARNEYFLGWERKETLRRAKARRYVWLKKREKGKKTGGRHGSEIIGEEGEKDMVRG